jgi:3-polyprenyl-4-hydroxybenzoate decarboxylase
MLQTLPARNADLDKFRLRRFVESLIEIGEVVVHQDPIPLAEVSAVVASTPKAVLFKDAGPDHLEMIAAVSGSRRRLAAAFGVDERQVAQEYLRRLGHAQPVVEVPSEQGSPASATSAAAG